jgi:hypothetical protein
VERVKDRRRIAGLKDQIYRSLAEIWVVNMDIVHAVSDLAKEQEWELLNEKLSLYQYTP